MLFFSKFIYWLLKLPNKKNLRNHASSVKFGHFCNFNILPNVKSIQFGENINIRNYCSIIVSNGAELTLSDNIFINNYCSINCLKKIEIGENTLLGEGVRLYDHNHLYNSQKVESQKFSYAPIKIGKNCWLGSNVVVLKGVTIGNNVIIGAGCIIHKDIPSNSIIINKQEHLYKNAL